MEVARVVESRNSDYQKGKLVVGSMGWTTYSVVDPTITQVSFFHPPPTTLPDFLCFLMQELGGATVHLVENLPRQLENSSLSKSSALGLLGIPGLTAYIGLMEIGKPKVTALAMVSQE